MGKGYVKSTIVILKDKNRKLEEIYIKMLDSEKFKKTLRKLLVRFQYKI